MVVMPPPMNTLVFAALGLVAGACAVKIPGVNALVSASEVRRQRGWPWRSTVQRSEALEEEQVGEEFNQGQKSDRDVFADDPDEDGDG